MPQDSKPVAEREEYERVYDAIKESPTALVFTEDGRAQVCLINSMDEVVPIAEFVPVVPESR